ncbi:phage tail tape measure protein [Halodesulfovibrio sp. MK-HDV]|uniref:phage tail tape measure protein n=1 Tax=Halodesulfovibrio sp. MK-HDV TaxID=2599925 RepID=UPI00136F0036|nr:phage tail tape measure protein [Halodesulfovibrio sp. MK-HDV]KAF1076300.1 hypothetical protein MKHDV_01321 [Halodesulfovibrio sp. MK-HDV]
MATKKHAAIIEIGGAVASSFKSVTQTVKGDFSEVGDSIRDLKKQQDMLEKFNPDEVRQAGREYRNLKREADKLERAFKRAAKPTRKMERDMLKARRAADKAGSAYKHQKSKLDALGKELKDAGVDTHKLASEQKRLAKSLDKAKAKMKAMQKASAAMQDVGDKFSHAGQQAGRMAVGVGATVAAFTAGVSVVNAQTAEQVRLAKALGVSGEAFSAWGGLAKEAGFEADAVGDLMEEMTNKLGESKGLGEITPVTESLQMLGLAFEDLENLSPEQQFETISSAIKNMDDAQKAQSAADILMGGEANKFFGYLRSRKEGVKELLDQQKQLNLMSDEGRKGALKYSQSVGKLGNIVSSAAGEFSGLIGGVLAPYIEGLAPKIGAMFEEHRDDIKAFGEGLGKALPKIGEFAFAMLKVMTSVGNAINWVAEAVGGFGNLAGIVGAIIGAKYVYSGVKMANTMWEVGRSVLPLITTAFPGLIAGIKAVGVAFMTNPIGLAIGAIVIAIGLVYLKWDSLKQYFIAGLKLLGRAFKYSPIGLIVGGIASAIDTVIVKWDALKKSLTGGMIGKIAAKVFGVGGNAEGASKKSEAQRTQIKQDLPRMDLPTASTTNSQQLADNRKYNITVHAAEGQNPQDVARQVGSHVDDSGFLYDGVC